jgi:NTP pyrophosphatase (non-canonical NTP hydrolase)
MPSSIKTPVTLRGLQDYVASQKSSKRKDKRKYFLKLIEEVGELAEMINSDQRWETSKAQDIKHTMEEELADVLFYIAALANVYEIDLEQSFTKKETIR